MAEILLEQERKQFHQMLIDEHVLSWTYAKLKKNSDEQVVVASNADKDSKSSRMIGERLARILGAERHAKLQGQTSGARFEKCVCSFIQSTFPKMQHMRPGNWAIEVLGNRGHEHARAFSQYEHLGYLNDLIQRDSAMQAALGNDYVVSPDIIIARNLLTDEEINNQREIVNSNTALKADLRKSNGGMPILHASISAKWTMRSDRAQNSRTEALNLIRNRKGHLPHIVVVTGEPLPNRIASLALGTGDIDCVYHIGLYELQKAVEEYSRETGTDDALETLQNLITGKRLKDISDLPLDLCV